MNATSENFSFRAGAGENAGSDATFAIPDTSTGLLRDLEKGQEATRWSDFERRYDSVVRNFIAVIARTHPLINPDDCEDFVQKTMLELWKILPRRGYDRSRGRFRDFLFGVVRKIAIRDSSDRLKRLEFDTKVVTDAANAAPLTENEFDDEIFRSEAEQLWRLVVDYVFAKGRWSDKSKAVFIRTERGESIAKVAAEYGLTPNAVYQLRYRAAPCVEAALRRLVLRHRTT